MIMRIVYLITVVILFPIASLPASVQVLIDRPGDPIGANLGWEFPGATMTIDTVKDAERGECRKIGYDFTRGGRYVQAELWGPFGGVRAVRFWYKNTLDGRGFIRVKDDTEQMFTIFFTYKPTVWQEIVIPLDTSQLKDHFGGANDGKIHFPIRTIYLGVDKPGEVKNNFWMDDFRIELAGANAMAGVRSRIQPGPVGGVAFLNEKTDYRLVLDNRFSTPQNVKSIYRIVNQDGKLIDEKKVDFSLAPFEIQSHPIALSTSQYGYQQIVAKLRTSGEKSIDLESGLAVVRKPQRYLQKDPTSFFAMIQDKGLYETNVRLGVKNLMFSYNWRWLETQPGNYTLDDELPKQLEKYNLGWMIKFNHFTPPWAEWTNAPRPELKSYIAPEHLASFEKWIQTTVGHYKGKLQSVEILNEPDLGYWRGANLDMPTAVDIYCKTLKAGYKGAKAGDPNVIVWGLGVSGYDQETGMRFTESVLERAGNDMDAIGNHPYASNRYIGKGKIAQNTEQAHVTEKCQKTLDLLAQHKKPREMYIGELGWALHLEEPALSEASMIFAQMVPQTHILVKTVPGVKSIYWFALDACDEGGYFYGLLRGWPGPMYPLPAACAYAICADLLDHTDVVGPVKIGPGIRAWRFDRNDADGSIVVFWSAEEPVTLTVNLPKGTQIIDSFGRTIAEGSKAEFSVDGLPIYAVTTKTTAVALANALENAQTRGSKDLKILQARLVGDTNLQMTVTNYTKSTIKAEFTFQKRKKTIIVQPGRQALSLGIRKIIPDPQAKPADLSAVWNNGQDSLAVRTDLVAVMNLTGQASAEEKIRKMLTESQPLVRNDRTSVLPSDPTIPWSGPEDLSLRSWTGWDEKDLFLAVEVADDTHIAGDTGEGFWMFDSIQLAVDPAADSTNAYDDNDVEFGLARGEKDLAVRLGYPTAGVLKTDFVKIERDETKKITRYLAAVPWTTFASTQPKPGQVFAFNVIANDNDGQGRVCWIGLTPGIGEEKRPQQYLHFVLTPK